MSISVEFQKRIRELVDETELKRIDIATKGNFNYHALSNAIVHGILPTTPTLVKMANYFNVSINYLLGKTNSNDFVENANVPFKTRFEELCREKGVTHYKVALDCFFDKSNISHWLSKDYLPTLNILNMLCNYFKVSPDYLLGRSDFKN